MDKVPVSFEAGSIHASFEQNEHMAFNPLLNRGVDELFDMLG